MAKGIISAYIFNSPNNLIFNVSGLEHLVAGTPVAFTDSLEMRDNLLFGHLDNVLGAANLVHLFSLGFQGTAFFTAEEEAGSSWRYLLEWFRRFGGKTDNLIVVDTSHRESADQPACWYSAKDANTAFDQQHRNIWKITTAMKLPRAIPGRVYRHAEH